MRRQPVILAALFIALSALASTAEAAIYHVARDGTITPVPALRPGAPACVYAGVAFYQGDMIVLDGQNTTEACVPAGKAMQWQPMKLPSNASLPSSVATQAPAMLQLKVQGTGFQLVTACLADSPNWPCWSSQSTPDGGIVISYQSGVITVQASGRFAGANGGTCTDRKPATAGQSAALCGYTASLSAFSANQASTSAQ